MIPQISQVCASSLDTISLRNPLKTCFGLSVMAMSLYRALEADISYLSSCFVYNRSHFYAHKVA
ncbi:hypothetical protein XBFFL1_2000004 [Xenorhabdus bovienii str. feltiae Florida]|nr:hypothetical protein XBFFR1_450011 [Xenorhabdus bovienii str. feltiae France]CDG92149.1 hypothetical protein XBFFL1_2000004 [Xenorhabdus bovienii str. feltiae Florida]